MKTGDMISWRAVNKVCHGTVEGEHPLGLIVRMDSGKKVIVNEESILNHNERQH